VPCTARVGRGSGDRAASGQLLDDLTHEALGVAEEHHGLVQVEELVREVTIIGPGAGPEQAGQGMFADLAAVARSLRRGGGEPPHEAPPRPDLASRYSRIRCAAKGPSGLLAFES
jgi:hypothetical protein